MFCILRCASQNLQSQVVLGNQWMQCPHFSNTPSPLHTPKDKESEAGIVLNP